MTKIFDAGDIRCSIEPDGMIRLKAASTFGDPVELSADDARALAEILTEFADKLDA